MKMKINKPDYNFYNFNLKKFVARFEGELTYINTFCVKNNYYPTAVFHNATPNRAKNHKDYLLAWIQPPYIGDDENRKNLIISGMDTDEIDQYKYQNGLYCLNCGEVIYSVYRHDYRVCKCGKCTVDGGKDYFKTNMGGQIVRINLLTDDIEVITYKHI